MYPTRWRFAVEAYKDATREPYSYLLVDLRPDQDEVLRLRTNVFPGETHYVYVPEKWTSAWNAIYQPWEEYIEWERKRSATMWKKCDRQFIDCVSECATNVFKGTVPLTNAQMSKLRPRRQDLRTLSVKKTSLAKKRKIIQKGGFLSALHAPALSVLAGLLLRRIPTVVSRIHWRRLSTWSTKHYRF